MLIQLDASWPLAVIPAVDVLDGEAVRLVRGRYAEVGVRAGDPLALVQRFAASAPPAIHFVDLAAARNGGVRPELVERAVEAAAGVPLQVAGGVRAPADALALAAAGAARVVVGTAAITGDPAPFVDALGARLVVAVDVRAGEVVVAGWERGSGQTLARVLERCAAAGVATVMVTATERDGTLTGPDLDLAADARGRWPGELVVAGGISSHADIAAVAEAGADAVVVGRALLG